MTPKIKRLLINYSNARRSWEAWCFMTNYNCKEKRKEQLDYINSNSLLFHLRYLAFKDFHIEIYKVLKKSKDDSVSIFKLLEETKLKDINKKREAELNLVELESCKTTVKELCDIRDKYYAHLDNNYEEYINTNAKISEISKCFIAIENSIITITSLDYLNTYLDKIPSRNDLTF